MKGIIFLEPLDLFSVNAASQIGIKVSNSLYLKTDLREEETY
jgi:hypothetical protein